MRRNYNYFRDNEFVNTGNGNTNFLEMAKDIDNGAGVLNDMLDDYLDGALGGSSAVTSVNGATGNVTLNAANLSVLDTSNNYVATTIEGVLAEIAPQLSGLTHTAITGIDLKSTGTPNEYTVEITWTDENGVAQTTTDPTPITLATETVTTLVNNANGSFTYTNENGSGAAVTYTEQPIVLTTDGSATGVTLTGFQSHTINIVLLSVDANQILTTGSDGGLFLQNSAIDHDALTNFVANEHIDHTAVSLIAGNGVLSGGLGDITADRTIALDIAVTADVQAQTANKMLDATVVIDEDTMVSDSDSRVPTQQSVKAYVDVKTGTTLVSSLAANWDLEASDEFFYSGTDATLTIPDINIVNNLSATFTIRKANVGDLVITLPTNVVCLDETDTVITTLTVTGDSTKVYKVFIAGSNLFWVDQTSSVTDIKVLSGTTDPSGSVNADEVNQLYLNTNSREIFRATDLVGGWQSVTNRIIGGNTLTAITSDHNNTTIQVTSAGSTITVDDVFPAGGACTIFQKGAGAITLTPGTGVVIRSADGALSTRAQYSAMTLLRGTVAGEYYLFGDIA